MSTDRKDAFEEDDADDVLNDGVLKGDVEEEPWTWFSVHVQPRVQPTQIWGNTNITIYHLDCIVPTCGEAVVRVLAHDGAHAAHAADRLRPGPIRDEHVVT